MEDRTPKVLQTINGQTYRISKMTPRRACWLFYFLLPKMRDGGLIAGLGKCTEAEINHLQNAALERVERLDTDSGTTHAMPVMVDGRIADPNISQDERVLNQLVLVSIGTSLEPFFTADGSAAQNSNQAAAQDGNL